MTYSDSKISEPARRGQRRHASAALPQPTAPTRGTGLYWPGEDQSSLTVSCAPADYSASVIARAVEDCDAHLLALEVMPADISAATRAALIIRLRINHRSPLAVARSLARYGYEALEISPMPDTGTDDYTADDTLTRRIAELIRHLEV